MTEELNVTELFRDALYSGETWATVGKVVLPFAIAGILLLLLKHLLKALERFIKGRRR